ncbi:hypothetical protein MBLNU459_g7819t1 [Dothideomycetes sp. NU459]
MDDSKKRSAPQDGDANKRAKVQISTHASTGFLTPGQTKKQWRMPRKNEEFVKPRTIQAGDSGIWVTCDKGREGKCIGELKDLFNDYAEELYGDQLHDAEEKDDSDGGEVNIEEEIQAELEGIKKPQTEPLFIPIRLDVQCVLFFKTRAPVEPVSFVRKICRDALDNSQRKRTRFAKRLSPMTLMGRASEEGLEKVAMEVLGPHFHQEPKIPRKFAIRPTLRNHNVLSRDSIIRQTAAAVGAGHKVDLKGYDDLIIVEAYTSICGMSVVPNDFEELKRYNLAEIFDPTPKEAPKNASKESGKEATQDLIEAPKNLTTSETQEALKAAPTEVISEAAKEEANAILAGP